MDDKGNGSAKSHTWRSDLAASLPEAAEPSEVFFELTRRLSSRFYISRGVLVLSSDGGKSLAAVSTWNDGQTRDGLYIKLPSDSSLFEQVTTHGRIYTEDFCENFSGNFFERKLLIDDESKSFLLQPLKHEGEILGLIGYSSDEPTAFAVFEEGAVDELIADFIELIRGKIRTV